MYHGKIQIPNNVWLNVHNFQFFMQIIQLKHVLLNVQVNQQQYLMILLPMIWAKVVSECVQTVLNLKSHNISAFHNVQTIQQFYFFIQWIQVVWLAVLTDIMQTQVVKHVPRPVHQTQITTLWILIILVSILAQVVCMLIQVQEVVYYNALIRLFNMLMTQPIGVLIFAQQFLTIMALKIFLVIEYVSQFVM